MTGLATLASFVPRVVRRRIPAGGQPAVGVEHVDGIVLASDVSGFTQLALSLRDAPGGIDELREILNDAFVRLIDAIDEAGGDVLGFAGDALIAFWPAGGDAAARAGRAALEAQRRLRGCDHRISLRIGLGAGAVAMSTVGGEAGRWFLVPAGPAAAEALEEQARAAYGEVTVTAAFEAIAGDSLDVERSNGTRRLVAAPGVDPEPAAETAPAIDDTHLPALRPYLPELVVDRLVAGHDSFVSELRPVTVALVLVPGSEDPAAVATLHETVAAVQRCAYRYDGLIAPAVDEKGLGVIVVFGARAHEDDVDRALAAARATDLELTRLGAAHGIGVTTCDAFCGVLGNDRRREYAVLSDGVNVAARLAAAACGAGQPNVLCEGSTADAARSRWSFATAVSLRLKGKEELHTAFGLADRLPRPRPRREAIIGRGAEIEWVLDQVATHEPGRGKLVVIEGEPGLGKSVLLGAVEESLEAAGVTVRTGFADALDRSAPLHAWSAVFHDVLDLDAVEGGDLAEHLLHRAGPLAPLLDSVLAVEVADTPESAALAGEQRVSASRALMLDLLAADRDRSGSLVVLLEDAHWFDSGSWALVHDAASLADVAVVVTTRPADEGTTRELAGSPAAATLPLAPLTASEVRDLALARLGAPDLDEATEKLLVETCQGNPFFTVEVVQTLADRGALAVESGRARLVAPEAFQVPRTIQAAISARIDDLEPDEQLTLKVASVIGSPFTADLVAEIHPTGRRREQLLDDLRSLAVRKLLVPDDDGAWAFNHALTREVAYGLMVREQRRSLHAALAADYEARGDDLDHFFPVLAHHWLHAEDRDRAVSYLTRAAVSSLAHGMPRESVAQGVQAARLLGVELETDPGRIRELLPGELAEIERLMAGRRPADLAGLPPLVDPEIGTGIGIVLQSMPAAHQSLQTELFALMAVRNLNLTLRFGAGPLVPGVYAMYSIVLHGLGGDAAVAYEFSELARTLDAAGGRYMKAAVDFIHVWFNNHWFNPVLSGVPVALEGAEAGLAGPDPLYGSFNLGAVTTFLAVGGRPLEEVIAAGEAHLARIGPRSATASFHNRLEAQMAKALAGRTDSLTSLTDPVAGEEELAAMAETANYNQAGYYYIAKLRLAYLAGDVRSAVRYAELAERLLPSFGAQVGQAELAVLSALARLADLPAEPALRGPALEGVRQQLAQLEQWAARCAPNFEHKAALVRGELAAATGDPDAADALLGAAAEQAAEAGFPQWAALAWERRGHAARTAGRTGASRCFEEAAGRYRAWGAHRKAAEVATEAELTRTPA